MKYLIIIFFISLFNPPLSLAESKDKKIDTRSACEKDLKSPECQKIINDINNSDPCLKDIAQFCLKKDFTKEANLELFKANEVSDCLNKNLDKLSVNCQDKITRKNSLQKCQEMAMSKCNNLKGHKEIACKEEVEALEFSKCQQ